jgi:hypothetical protein
LHSDYTGKGKVGMMEKWNVWNIATSSTIPVFQNSSLRAIRIE